MSRGRGTVLKAVTLTLLLYCLLPPGIFQAMWSKSRRGSEYWPSGFELSLCKTAEKDLPESLPSLGTARGTALGLPGLSVAFGAPALGPQLGILQEQLTGSAELCCSWKPKPSLLSLL